MTTEEEHRRQETKDNYDHLRATHRSQASSLNQLIFAISGGTLGWSIAYMDKIADSPPKCFFLIQLSWILLIISIVALGIALWASVTLLGKAVGGEVEACAKSKLNSMIGPLNLIFTFSALMGLVLFGLFGMSNTDRIRNPQMAKNPPFIPTTQPLAYDHGPNPGASVGIALPVPYSPPPSPPSAQPAAPPPPPPAGTNNSGK